MPGKRQKGRSPFLGRAQFSIKCRADRKEGGERASGDTARTSAFILN